MGWGDMVRERMKKDVELSMRIRRIRRVWYHLTDDTPEEIVGFLCLLLAFAVCVGAWYLYGTARCIR